MGPVPDLQELPYCFSTQSCLPWAVDWQWLSSSVCPQDRLADISQFSHWVIGSYCHTLTNFHTFPLAIFHTFTLWNFHTGILYRYYYQRRDIRWNTAWPQGKSRYTGPYAPSRAEPIGDNIAQLSDQYWRVKFQYYHFHWDGP